MVLCNPHINLHYLITGPEDNVRCFYCGGAVTKWEPDDDPWAVHARFYPACPHIKLTKGQEFIDSVTRKNNRPEDNQSPTVAKDNNSTAVNLRYALQAVKYFSDNSSITVVLNHYYYYIIVIWPKLRIIRV